MIRLLMAFYGTPAPDVERLRAENVTAFADF